MTSFNVHEHILLNFLHYMKKIHLKHRLDTGNL